MLSVLPRFNAARRYGWGLLAVGTVFAVLGIALVSSAVMRARIPWTSGMAAPPVLGLLGAALWTAAAGFLPAAILSFVRQQALAVETGSPASPVPAAAPVEGQAASPGNVSPRMRRIAARLAGWLRGVELLASGPPPLVAILFGVLALAGIVQLWRLPAEPVLDPVSLKLIAGSMLATAFPLLVLERIFANIPAELLPEAPQLNRLLRVPLVACLALAFARGLLSLDLPWAALIERVLAVLIALVSLELILRCSTVLFVPFAPLEDRVSLADSSIAGCLRLGPPSLGMINIAVRRQLGIDLSRSWALAFMQKAALPVLLGLGVFAWALTGVTSLGLNQRGIYERFGAPVTVLSPGLHVHLPWPLGRVHPVELGVVHLLPIEFVLPGGENAETSSSVGGEEDGPPVAADAPAPPEADRLWTDDHPFEGSYIIASEENGQQSFQLVDIDMAVIYRVGAADAAARNAAYRVNDIDELIQALSGRILVRYFTHNTLLDLLGRSREDFTRQFQAALQAQLDRFSTGVEAVGISVEAIHPPPGAAAAYHDVQAAEIHATTRISTQRGEAARSMKAAQRDAGLQNDEALASAAERVGQADSQRIVFGGDRQAYATAGYPFLLERWLDDLSRGLGSSSYVLIDHRLGGAAIPALDLRGARSAARADTPTVEPLQRSPEGSDEDD